VVGHLKPEVKGTTWSAVSGSRCAAMESNEKYRPYPQRVDGVPVTDDSTIWWPSHESPFQPKSIRAYFYSICRYSTEKIRANHVSVSDNEGESSQICLHKKSLESHIPVLKLFGGY
jgi:hypothetical protein